MFDMCLWCLPRTQSTAGHLQPQEAPATGHMLPGQGPSSGHSPRGSSTGVHPKSLLYNRDPEKLAEDVIALANKITDLTAENVSHPTVVMCSVLPVRAFTWCTADNTDCGLCMEIICRWTDPTGTHRCCLLPHKHLVHTVLA